jgi:SAM-dependent methyltransferase
MGEEFFSLMVRIGFLEPHEKVLDVGCGVGRLAVPLTRYLDSEGRYEGVDIVPEYIDWCQRNITAKNPNFRFRVADIYNSAYNPNGKYRAADYRFPFDDASFDFVFLASVFTHMLPADMENYFREISRTMKPGGRCLITFFLLNPESVALMEAGSSELAFAHDYGRYRAVDADTKEADVCYDEAYVLELYKRHRLQIIEPVHYGSWSGRPDFLSFQDIVVARKL